PHARDVLARHAHRRHQHGDGAFRRQHPGGEDLHLGRLLQWTVDDGRPADGRAGTDLGLRRGPLPVAHHDDPPAADDRPHDQHHEHHRDDVHHVDDLDDQQHPSADDHDEHDDHDEQPDHDDHDEHVHHVVDHVDDHQHDGAARRPRMVREPY